MQHWLKCLVHNERSACLVNTIHSPDSQQFCKSAFHKNWEDAYDFWEETSTATTQNSNNKQQTSNNDNEPTASSIDNS
eukprot:5841455-Amphidinium_carterae.1